MFSVSVKIFVGPVGGLLFMMAGCGPVTVVEDNPAASAETNPTTTFANVIETDGDQAAITPTPSPPPPRPTASPSSTPTLEAMPIPKLNGPAYVYHTVGPGETLGYLAWKYDTTIEELVAMNDLDGPGEIIHVDQSLRVPVDIDNVASQMALLPDSEVVYGPAYVGFDIAVFVEEQGGYLATYEQYVEGQPLTGAEIVQRVAEQFSVGPRILLALLEHYSGWVTSPEPPARALNKPMGPRNPRGSDLFRAMGFTANRINAGYYGYKRDGFWIFELADRSRAITPEGLNAGTVGLQNILAIHSNADTWPKALSEEGFMATYRQLFDDHAADAVEPLIPINLTQPPLSLPWREGQGFYFTGGAHPAFIDGSAWAAVDFGPPDVLGNCFYSNEPNTAAGDGVIVTARQGEVQLDLDGDGHIQTGWVLLYLHVALDFDTPVQLGQRVKEGDVIGYASCENGLSSSSHLHFARRYNGEWMAAAGPVPLNLSGWVVQPALVPYGGAISNGSQVRTPCECWDADMNLIIRSQTEE